MQVFTQSSPRTNFSSSQEQFLIIPIFFKKQIESLVKAQEPAPLFGFFYGEQRENYRIIKKIWPVAHAKSDANNIELSLEDFNQAKKLESGDKMRLLGCFYTSENGAVKKALLSSKELNSFSFLELKESKNETCIWSSSILDKSKNDMMSQKVIV
ncbi:MAG: hypothetical protein KDC53_06080 [Saprospiraceae bacterium]|nr:hypothetical protein [Saprospiraceae bacterium]